MIWNNNKKVEKIVMNKLISSLALAMLTVVAACGGAGTNDINRVQPNVTHKALFQGEWYMGATIVEKQYANSWVFEGIQDELKIIRWEITEDTLYGYLAYDQVPGTEGVALGEHRVAMAFPIEGHFDIRREYNTQTGRENNVIVENTNDRPWWERDYIRVNWGSYGGPGTVYGLTMGGFVSAVSQASINRNVDSNPVNPWRARIEKDYIETTIHSILQPDGYACSFLDKWGGLSCAPTEAKLKYSFWKVPEERTYEANSYLDAEGDLGFIYNTFQNIPVTDRFGNSELCRSDDDILRIEGCVVDGEVFCECRVGEVWQSTEFAAGLCDPELNDIDSCYQAAISKWSNHGFFRTARHYYDRERGSTVSGREYYAQRFNIWETAYNSDSEGVVRSLTTGATAIDDDGDAIGCEVGDDLEDVEVSRRTLRVDRQDNGDATRFFEVMTCGKLLEIEEECERQEDNTFDCEVVDTDTEEVFAASLCTCDTRLAYEDRTPKTITYYLNAGFPEFMMDSIEPIESEWNKVFLNAIAASQDKTVEEVEEDFAKDGEDFKAFEIKVNNCNPENIRDYVSSHSILGLEELLNELGLSTEDDDLGIGNMEQVCAALEFAGRKYLDDRGVVLRPNDDGNLEYVSFLGEDLADFGPSDVFKWEQTGNVRYSFLNWVHEPDVSGPLGMGPSFADPRTGENISAVSNIYGASMIQRAINGADAAERLSGALSRGDVINGTHIREYLERVRNRPDDFDADVIGQAFMMKHDHALGAHGSHEDIPRIPLSGIGETRRRLNEAYAGSNALSEFNFEDEFLVSSDMEYLFGGGIDAPSLASEEDMRISSRPSSWMSRGIPNQLAQLATNGIYDSNQLLTVDGGRPTDYERHNHEQIFLGERSFCFFGPEIQPAMTALGIRLAERGVDRDEMEKIILRNTMIGVTAHEIGHNVGLRHNFSASTDALNFFPEWWGLDGVDYLKKRYDRSDDADLDDGAFDRQELAYSSIMDYHQEVNDDWGGLGPYDQASIMLGYVDMVEIFDEDENGNGIVEEEEEFMPRTLFLGWVTYDDYPYMLSGDIDLLNENFDKAIDGRRVGVEDAIFEPSQSGATPRPENMYKRKYIPFNEYLSNLSNFERVPYEFCTDQFRGGINVKCQVWDKGVSMTEIVQNYKKMYDYYHLITAYQRDRSSDFVNQWPSILYGRTLERVLNTYQWFYFFRRGFARVFPFVQDYASAAHVGLNFINEILQAPEPGRYCLESGEYIHESEATGGCGTSIDIDGLYGRPLETEYQEQYEGYLPYFVGHVYDKIAALNALSSTEGFLYGSLAADVSPGAFSIGYYRTFHEELEELMIEHITGDFSRNTYRVMSDGEVVSTPLVVYDEEIRSNFPEGNDYGFGDPSNYDANGNFILGGTPIRPSHNFWMKVYAIYYALTGFTSIYDESLDMAERSQISIVGSAHDPIRSGPDFDEVLFSDPRTGVTYRAYEFADGRGNIASTLLKDARDYVNSAAYQGASTDAARRAADKALDDKLALIDYVKLISTLLEYGQ